MEEEMIVSLEKRFPDLEKQIRVLWAKEPGYTAVARALGVNRRSATKYCKALGLTDSKRGNPEVTKIGPESVLRRWLRLHPGNALPRSYREISRLTGVNRRTVKSFFVYHRRKLRAELKALPDLRRTTLRLVGSDGRKWPLYYMKSIQLAIDPWSLKIVMRARVKPYGTKELVFHPTLSALKKEKV